MTNGPADMDRVDPTGDAARRPRLRTWGRRVLALTGTVVLAVLALNGIGLVRYPGGPLRDASDDGPLLLDLRPADQGFNAVGNGPTDWATVGRPIPFGLIHVTNPWPVGATIEAVTPLEVTPGLIVERVIAGALPAGAGIGWGVDPASGGAAVDGALRDLPVVVPAASTEDRATSVVLIVSAVRPGEYGFRGVAIDYRVGPFTFRAIRYVALDSCIGPFASNETCTPDQPAAAATRGSPTRTVVSEDRRRQRPQRSPGATAGSPAPQSAEDQACSCTTRSLSIAKTQRPSRRSSSSISSGSM